MPEGAHMRPSIVVLEVYRHLRRFLGVETAIRAVAPMSEGHPIDLDAAIGSRRYRMTEHEDDPAK